MNIIVLQTKFILAGSTSFEIMVKNSIDFDVCTCFWGEFFISCPTHTIFQSSRSWQCSLGCRGWSTFELPFIRAFHNHL